MNRSLSALRWHRHAPAEDGATAIEYALMVVMVALVILAAAASMGGTVTDWFTDMATRL